MLTYHSDRQPIPDNQEAFLTPVGQFDARLIFEITEHIKPESRPHIQQVTHGGASMSLEGSTWGFHL
jgi:acyl-coenzyme A thioesterase PaaI-like protein